MAILGFPSEHGDQIRSRLSVGREELSGSPMLAARDKPYNPSDMALPIALGVTIPVVTILCVLVFLWRRNIRKQRIEDAKDPHRDLDFGLGDTPLSNSNKKSTRKSFLGIGGGEKNIHKNQLSMDMNLSSPYLLPPQHQDSRDSLSRNYATEYDPYQVVNSEVGSIKSFGKDSQYKSGPNRQGSFPKSSLSSEKADPFATPAAPEPAHRTPSNEAAKEPIHRVQPVVPEIGTIESVEPTEPAARRAPQIQEPPPTVAKNPQDRVASPPTDTSFDFGVPPSSNTTQTREPIGLDLDLGQPMSPIDDLMFTVTAPSDPQPAQQTQTQTTAMAGVRESKESFYGDQPQIRTSEYYDVYDDYERGRAPQRQSRQSLEYYEQPAQPQPRQTGGLDVPQQQAKRLSVGLRPLPPADELQSDDPEHRANRIRSFYKEYFDESREAGAPPMPGAGAPAPRNPATAYYEDYDERYLGQETAFFDPDNNAFVMPGAQPVHRRAMTPPPAGRRGPGNGPRSASRGPPGRRGPHGSLGGMSSPGGPRSQSAWGPRPESSASRRSRKNLLPPAALSTLPTPSKLKDDSFALMNATDFAPPEAFGERARGRSQSPLGERRAYQPKLPAASPLVHSYDEMSALPSPHLLRKSSTFTGLDFAPPKKFKDADTMSDAGSIRSNKSGMSMQAQHAIRAGAGRVSRLPGDEVFTKQAMSNELKPQWTLRP